MPEGRPSRVAEVHHEVGDEAEDEEGGGVGGVYGPSYVREEDF